MLLQRPVFSTVKHSEAYYRNSCAPVQNSYNFPAHLLYVDIPWQQRDKGYFNCGALKPRRQLPLKLHDTYQGWHPKFCIAAGSIISRRCTNIRGESAAARAHCEQNIMPATLQNHLHAGSVDLLRCIADWVHAYICST